MQGVRMGRMRMSLKRRGRRGTGGVGIGISCNEEAGLGGEKLSFVKALSNISSSVLQL